MEIRGAEAVLTEETYEGKPAIRKNRIKKAYRLPKLDQTIRGERTLAEERLLVRARRAGVRVPTVWTRDKTSLILEKLPGTRVKELLETTTRQRAVAAAIGRAVGKLHRAGIIHGDLTTSNMIWDKDIAFIDFGLGKMSRSAESQATDLYVLKEALNAAHSAHAASLWEAIVHEYEKEYPDAARVLKQFAIIERRRRYRG
ncbi:MAG: Kae1-associated serine/threonine protein kinase [Nanoarchaeota archaeon]|nr:Kae1-associated serine/threonine protein kinase [Nanoarchaeota archaeon]